MKRSKNTPQPFLYNFSITQNPYPPTLGFWGFGVLGFWGFGVLGFRRYLAFRSPSAGAMASAMELHLNNVFTDLFKNADGIDEGMVVYLVDKLHRAGIVNPNDLGFLCTAGGG